MFNLIYSYQNLHWKSIPAYVSRLSLILGSPYHDLSPRKLFHIGLKRSETMLLLVPFRLETNASLVFDITEQNLPLYMDNIKLTSANIVTANPDQNILFLTNASPVKRM